jgi:hypothetical protein
MKKAALFLMLIFCLGLTACSNNTKIDAFIIENNAVVEDIVRKIDANPTEAGVDEAQKSFDAKKADLRAKWDAVKNIRGTQVSPDMIKKLNDNMSAGAKMLTDIQQKHSQKLTASGDAINKFRKLFQAYADIIKP